MRTLQSKKNHVERDIVKLERELSIFNQNEINENLNNKHCFTEEIA